MTIIQRLVATYKLWRELLVHFPHTSRYTLGEKIDYIFVEVAELIFTAIHLDKNQKLSYIQKASIKLDTLKFLLQISWEIKSLDNKKYIILSEHLSEIGKMLGGWIKQISQKTPASK